MEMRATCIRVPPPDLKSHTRLVRLRGRTSLRDRFSGTFRDPALSNEVLPPELLESSVSYSCSAVQCSGRSGFGSTWWARLVRLLYLRLKKI